MCDCKLKGFATWLKTVSSITPAQKSAITCETPMNPEPRVIMDLDPSDFVCSNEVPLGPLAIIQKEEEEKQHKEKEDDNDGGHNARHFTAVSESGLELSDYQYKSSKNVLSLIWVVDERSIPYECDAVFIFKEEDGNHQLKSKTKVMCHSNSESNPKRLTIRLNHLDLEMNQTYRFCLVVFSSATLVAGCSESLHLRVGATGKELYGVAISPHSKWNSDDHSPTTNPRSSIVPRPTLKVNWVNGSTLDTVTVWWDFVAGLQQLPTSCLLNVSLIAGNKVAIEKRAKCAKGRTNFTNLNPLETYEVCISIVQPHPLPPATASLLHGDNRCVDIRPTSLTATPITSNRLLITVITTILVCIVMLLMGAIFLLARRICWPSSKSDNLLSPPCRDGPQYRVLYHQPEEGPRPSLLHSRTASSNEITPV